MQLRTLRQGATGSLVGNWQTFLRGQGLYLGTVDADFGAKTDRATRAFQRRHGLGTDGVVGTRTWGKALLLGFAALEPDEDTTRASPNWPPRPVALKPLATNATRARAFGRFDYEDAPTASSPEQIRVLGSWARDNIVRVELPQLITGGIRPWRTVRFHKNAAEALQTLWSAWEAEGLLPLIQTWNGSYVARYVRGSRSTLSNHAFGSAFDINHRHNRLGTVPALVGRPGSVRELVHLANQHGFYWGGHFPRPDGIHFEATEEALG